MPRRSVLTPAERSGLLAFPNTDDEFVRYYTFSESDLAAIRQRRGKHNRLGFAVQLCYLRHPGFASAPASIPHPGSTQGVGLAHTLRHRRPAGDHCPGHAPQLA